MDNCGACGVVCGAGESCVQGSCQCASTGTVTWSEVETLLGDTCTNVGCHGGVRPQAKLSLEAGESYDSLVNVKTDQCGGARIRVTPGSPAQSYLLQKLMGVDICFGTQMPKVDMKLPQQDIDTISDWICSGAPP
jgi:hypothetical protein